MFKLVNNTIKSVVKTNNLNLLNQQFKQISISNKCKYIINNNSNNNNNNSINNNNNSSIRYYSSSSANEDKEQDKKLEKQVDSKIGYLTSESNVKKVIDENYISSLRTTRDFHQAIEQETTPKPKDTRYDYTVTAPIPRPDDDEMYAHPTTRFDISDKFNQSQLPVSDLVDDSLLADTLVFKPFTPKRPFLNDPVIVNGVSTGYSKRKRSCAVAKIKLGTGKLTINGRTLADYFDSIAFRDTVLQPLVITETIVKWDIDIEVFGGGIKGQSQAARRALGLALVNYDLGYRPALKASGVLKADARKVERKKPGQLKARKKFPLVKR